MKSNFTLLGSVLMSAATVETGSNKPAKKATTKKTETKAPANSKAKADAVKGAGKAAAAAKTPAAKAPGGGRKPPVFSDKSKIHEALVCIRDGKPIESIGLSQHHIRQLGAGVSGGEFGPGKGLGFVEMIRDPAERKEGERGRRKMIPALTKTGKQALQVFEMNAKRKAAKESGEVKPKVEKAPKAPAVATQPASEPAQEVTVTVPEGTEVKVETVAEGDQSQAA